MNSREKQIIKEIRPLLDKGVRGRIMQIYQNLTTGRRQLPKCKCGCGKLLIQHRYGPPKEQFGSNVCLIRWRRNERNKQQLKMFSAAMILLLPLLCVGVDIRLGWVNGSNAVPMQTHIYYGPVNGVITQIVTNEPGITNCTIRNLRFGTVYFFRAMHMGPLGKEWSEFSNQVTTKTRPPMEATGRKANVGRMRSP